jgi:TDG/mug DNA glycosylase family protein
VSGEATDRCFDAVTDRTTRVLVLGSLPGQRSLQANEYYANPRNQFWRLIGAVIRRPGLHDLAYTARLEALLAAGVGLGDTVAAATRRGSLDANIRLHEASDLTALIATLPGLRAVAFNGSKAATIGRRQLVTPTHLDLINLPSSSPAYAALSFENKRSAWCALQAYLAPR